MGDGVRGVARERKGSEALMGAFPREARRRSTKSMNSSWEDSIGLSEYVLDRRIGGRIVGVTG